MNSNFFTPRRILLAVAAIALILLFRECLKNRNSAGSVPDQVNIRYDSAPNNLNPFLTNIGANIFTCARIFQTLGDLDAKTLELAPVMIKQIPVMRPIKEGAHAGELAYDFEILPEAVWDNGKPITGEDFAFAMKVIFHPLLANKAFLGYFKDLSGVEIDSANPKKFTVYFRQYYMLALESMCQTPLLPAYNYDAGNLLGKYAILDFLDTAKIKTFEVNPDMVAFADAFKQPKFTNDPNSIVGSGPYRVEIMNDQGAILVKKENWWGDKLVDDYPLLGAYPKRLVYKTIKAENVVESMMKNGELDIIANSLSAAKYLEMQKNDSLSAQYNFEMMPPMQYNRWMLNHASPKLQDIRVRRALAYLVDYDHLIKNVRLNQAIRTVSPILPTKSYYAKELPQYDFNVDKAKALLNEAGWTDSDGDGYVDKVVDGVKTKFTLEILSPISPINQRYAESITETARLCGIEIKAVTVDINEIGKKTKDGEYESALLGSSLFPGLTELSQRYHSKYLSPAGDNRSRYVNTSLDKVLEAIGAEADIAKRGTLYLEAQKIIYNDLPEIFLLAPFQPVVTSKKFKKVTTGNRPGYYEHLFRLAN